MKFCAQLLILLMLAACARPEPCINYLECPDSPMDCTQQAHETCPSGYHVLQESDVGPDFAAFTAQHFGGASVSHIIVRCN